MTAHNLARYDAPTGDDLRAQIAELTERIRFHRALGAWQLCNILEVDRANTVRALRRLESEPVSVVRRVP